MRKVSGLQVMTFLCLLTLAVAVALSVNYLLFGALALGDFRGVFMTATGVVLCYLAVILVFRLFCAGFPLPEGDIAVGSTAEFRYHVYLLFFLIVFYPVMFSMILPVPLMRVFYQLLGARLGPNTYPGGVLMDPPFVTIGSNTIVGQGALIVPHVIEGSRLAHRRISIGNDVTIGGRAVVLSGCSIGDGATVAIGAVVSKGTVIGAGEVWGGIPARRLAQAGVADQPAPLVTG